MNRDTTQFLYGAIAGLTFAVCVAVAHAMTETAPKPSREPAFILRPHSAPHEAIPATTAPAVRDLPEGKPWRVQ